MTVGAGTGRGRPGLPQSVLIVGTGLLGTSLALALQEFGTDVALFDTRAEHLAAAVARGAGRAVVDPAAVDVDVAVVAVPPMTAPGVAIALLDAGRAAVVTDVTSVKRAVSDAVLTHPQGSRFVGGHPMAGREIAGPEAAVEDLFRGRTWVVCPTAVSAQSAIDTVATMAAMVGSRPTVMEAAGHDRGVALVSHAPYAVAGLMARRLEWADPADVALAGPGIGDTTRVAASDPALWAEILVENADAVREVLAGVRRDLDALVGLLRTGDPVLVRGFLQHALAGRTRLPGKHGQRPVGYDTLCVRVDDRPGQLASLFADCALVDVNIEDVRMEHVAGEPTGVVLMSVVPESSAAASSALRALGWTVTREPGAGSV